MTLSRPIDFVTVIYEPEIGMLELQARSFATFVPQELVGQIILIGNDTQKLCDHLKSRIVPCYGDLAKKVIVHPKERIAPGMPSWGHGWKTQQVLKLCVCDFVNTASYIVLDAKNHFIRPISPLDIFAENGHLRSWKLSYIDNFENLCRSSFEYFGIDAEAYITRLPPSITPVPLIKEYVRGLLNYILEKERLLFQYFFFKHDAMTEFLIYYAYLIYRGKSLDDIFEFGEPVAATLFKDKVVDFGNFDSLMWQAEQPSRYIFGIHNSALPFMSEHQRKRVIDLWAARGLFPNRSAGEAFFSNQLLK